MANLIPQYSQAGKLRKAEQQNSEFKRLRMGDANETLNIFMSDGVSKLTHLNLLQLFFKLQEWKRKLIPDLKPSDQQTLQGIYTDGKNQMTLLWNQRKPYSAMKFCFRTGHEMVRFHSCHPTHKRPASGVAATLAQEREDPDYCKAVETLEMSPEPQQPLTQPWEPTESLRPQELNVAKRPGKRMRPHLVREAPADITTGETLAWDSDA